MTDKPRILLLDIESAPARVYTWTLFQPTISIKQIEEPGYTLCWSAKWLDEKEMHFSSVQHNSPKKMLAGIHKLMDEADIIVHYNGLSYDIPCLNRDFILNGFTPPSPAKHVDLYKEVKANFRFQSSKLDWISQSLGLGAKVEHKGHDMFKGCMEGDERSWAQMRIYNERDVRLLQRLYKRLLPWLKRHPNMGMYAGEPVCVNCGSKDLQRRGVARTAVQVYPRLQCNHCGKWNRGAVTESPKGARHILRQDMG